MDDLLGQLLHKDMNKFDTIYMEYLFYTISRCLQPPCGKKGRVSTN